VSENHFQPKIVAFFCTWCTYTAADLTGISRLAYAPNVRVMRLMCSGRLDPQFVLAAFRYGADGVLIGGCHLGDCHYQQGNYKTRRRIELLRAVLRDLGVEDQRLRLEWRLRSPPGRHDDEAEDRFLLVRLVRRLRGSRRRPRRGPADRR
jgi:F420-non-reducing hydrogenase iron-sulfur subunit